MPKAFKKVLHLQIIINIINENNAIGLKGMPYSVKLINLFIEKGLSIYKGLIP
jgi:hypothetical protein